MKYISTVLGALLVALGMWAIPHYAMAEETPEYEGQASVYLSTYYKCWDAEIIKRNAALFKAEGEFLGLTFANGNDIIRFTYPDKSFRIFKSEAEGKILCEVLIGRPPKTDAE